MSYVRITKQEMDDKLRTEKGWICNHSGNEYIYDFHLKKYPIIIKVASTIRVDNNRARNRGSDVIRVFAVKKNGLNPDADIIGGVCKATRVNRTIYWRNNLRIAVEKKIKSAKYVYDKMEKNRS